MGRRAARIGCVLAVAFGFLVASGAQSGDPAEWDPALGTAEVRGICVFTGDPPPPAELPVGDPRCAELHGGPHPDESLRVGANGALAGVLVRVSCGLERWRFPGPSEAVLLDQRGCRFIPRILAFQAGAPVRIRNSDPLSHNAHGLTRRNSGFNLAQARAGSENIVVLAVPEIGVRVRCDIHPWMTAYLCAIEHPFFAVTGEDGLFRLPLLPPGDYRLEAWHEKLGVRQTDIRVDERGQAEVRFEFAPR